MTRRFFCKLILVVMAVFSVLVLSGVAFGQGRSDEALERVIDIQERYTGALMARDGVEGTGIGHDNNGQLAIKVYTATAGIPGIPQQLDGVPVQAVVTGKFIARLSTTDRWPRPVPIGISTGHPDITAGTIGCRVKDAGGNVYALSNNHVYANSNDALLGDSVLQPGSYDGGQDTDFYRIGTLYDYEPILFNGSDNTIDAAIADSTTSLLGFETPSDGYLAPSSVVVSASPGLPVQKYGRTTGWTSGTVDAINATVDICYECAGPFCFNCKKLARFVNQIIITPGAFSDGGDSGSLIVTYDINKNPVGLLFAGSSAHTIANRIDLVLGRFGVTVDDGSPLGPVTPVADFQGSPTSGDTPLTVNFIDLSSGEPTSWSWNFGDGGTSTLQDPSYTYNMAGTYTVTLTATNGVGSDAETKTDYIDVSEPAPPVADFQGSPTSGDAPLIVNFTDWSSGEPTSWSWDFGNGGTSTAQNPSNTYDTPGTYTVILIATNTYGSDPATKVDYITVNEPNAGINVGSIDPDIMQAGSAPMIVTITGSGFEFGADVTFENGSGPTPTASNVVVIDVDEDGVLDITATITAKNGGPPRNRFWDVRVTNPDGSSDVLDNGFTVTP
jgi:PKD repeat protein